MVINEKSHAQVDEELIDLIGADLYDPGFGQWLFSLFTSPTSSFSSPPSSAPPATPDPQISASIKPEPSPQPPAPIPTSPRGGHIDYEPLQRPAQAKSPPSSSVTFRNAIHEASRQEAPHQQPGGKSLSKGSVLRHSRRETHGTPYGTGNTDPARKSRGKVPPLREDGPTFSIQLPTQARKNVYLAKDHQHPGSIIPAPSSETASDISDNLKRCSFWPNCTKGSECPYFHPSELCSLYPLCPNSAETCRFIHPAGSESSSSSFSDTNRAPCRFAEGCTNPRCTFAHPRGRRLPGGPGGGLGGGSTSVPCRFGSQCTNPSCPFQHQIHGAKDPSQDIGELLAPEASTPLIPPTSSSWSGGGGSGKKLHIPCREGEACQRKATCMFLHPGETPTSSQVPCRFGAQCTRKDCIYKHPHRNRSVRFDSDGKPIHEEGEGQRKSDRAFVSMEEDETEKLYVPNQGTSHLLASRRDWKGQEVLHGDPTTTSNTTSGSSSTSNPAPEEDSDVVMGLS